MREIKFRAWDGLDILEVAEISFCRKLLFYKFGASDTKRFDEIELMQYIGLKDKNGTEIYEDDIVLYLGYAKYRIEFLNGSFVARKGTENIENMEPCCFDYGLEVEVIGNIHENPELLKDMN